MSFESKTFKLPFLQIIIKKELKMSKKVMKIIQTASMVLLVLGGLNWGLVGFLGVDVIGVLLGLMISSIIYVVVGVAALAVILGSLLKIKKK